VTTHLLFLLEKGQSAAKATTVSSLSEKYTFNSLNDTKLSSKHTAFKKIRVSSIYIRLRFSFGNLRFIGYYWRRLKAIENCITSRYNRKSVKDKNIKEKRERCCVSFIFYV
jgi:hypothetical protein